MGRYIAWEQSGEGGQAGDALAWRCRVRLGTTGSPQSPGSDSTIVFPRDFLRKTQDRA